MLFVAFFFPMYEILQPFLLSFGGRTLQHSYRYQKSFKEKRSWLRENFEGIILQQFFFYPISNYAFFDTAIERLSFIKCTNHLAHLLSVIILSGKLFTYGRIKLCLCTTVQSYLGTQGLATQYCRIVQKWGYVTEYQQEMGVSEK